MRDASGSEFQSFFVTVGGNEGQKCHYPTRLDTYGCGCGHNCRYCYAKEILGGHGYWHPDKPAVADLHKIESQLLSTNCHSWKTMKQLDFERVIKAVHAYITLGRVDEDDDINRLIFMILQWYMSQHPDRVSTGNRGYLLYALMYLHLYRTSFTRFGGTPEGVKAWQAVPLDDREEVAASFRRHLSEMREVAARKGEWRF